MALLSSLFLVSPMFVAELFLGSLRLLSCRLPTFFIQISGTCMVSARITAFSRGTRVASWNWTILAMEGTTMFISDSRCLIKFRISMHGKFEMFRNCLSLFCTSCWNWIINNKADHFTCFVFITQHDSCTKTSFEFKFKHQMMLGRAQTIDRFKIEIRCARNYCSVLQVWTAWKEVWNIK